MSFYYYYYYYCISQVNRRPGVVNPLTVSENKGKCRLVLDCRHINPHLFKYAFKYEDAAIAKDTFKKGDFVFGFDLKSAYHHIDILGDHRIYLGFMWDFGSGFAYFVFNVLPFGISTAAYVFTKLTRAVISYWRYSIIMFLDDGLGGASDLNTAEKLSMEVQKDLSELGFLLAVEKCNWQPQTID